MSCRQVSTASAITGCSRAASAPKTWRAPELLLTLPSVIPIDAIKAATAKPDEPNSKADEQQSPEHPCPCCGGRMIIIERFTRDTTPRHQPTAAMVAVRIDTS
jgi:hypothetical protein